MILAAPLVIPFAKAVGLSVGTLGMAALADKVNDYIETNPEESSMILKTLIPNLGIGEIFMNKEKISIEDLDEMSDQEAADLPTDIKADLMKQGGKSRGGNKRELMKELSRKLGLSGPGKKQKDMEYDADERYEGGVEEKADGGAIGIEVLFEEKKPRKNFFMGGPALEGQALSIYNSMNAYGFSDQEIANALEGQGYYTPGGTTTPDAPTTIQPIGYQGRGDDNPYAGQVVDQTDYSFNKKNYGPGKKLEINPAAVGMSFYDAEPKSNTEIYGQGIDMNKARSFEENKALIEKAGGIDKIGKPVEKNFIGRTIDSFMGAAVPGKQLSQFTSPGTGDVLKGPAELGFMSQNIEGIPGNLTREDLRSMYDNYNKFLGRPSNFVDARVKGTAGQMFGNIVGAAAGIPFLGKGINMLSNAFGPGSGKSDRSKYAVDNAGFGQGTGRDEFGVFTGGKTLFGDTTSYGERMQDKLDNLEGFFGSRIDDFDINNLTPDMLDKMSKINGFYTKQIQAYKQRLATENINKRTRDAIEAQKIQEELAAAAAAKDKAAALAAIKKQGEASYNPNIHGPNNYGIGSDGKQSFDSEMGFGINSTTGGPVSNRTGRGRQDYSKGGLATMFKEKR